MEYRLFKSELLENCSDCALYNFCYYNDGSFENKSDSQSVDDLIDLMTECSMDDETIIKLV